MSNVAIPGYRIERLLGEGGRGIVYEAHDTRSDRRVALKILHAGQGQNSEKLVALKHPHIAAVLDAGRFGGQVFVATEYLSGGTLKEHVQSLQSVGDTFPPDQILSYADQIADALVYAHGQGVSHGHLRSEDVMFSEDGTLKLTDFNPETGSDFQQATRTDLLAYGGLLSELATGKRPLPGVSVPQAIVRSDLPVTFTQIVVRILDRDRQDRYEDLSQVIDDLRPAASDMVTQAAVSRPQDHSNFGAGRVLAERFRIVEFIAMGGMGEVYEAEDLELGERVALKTIRPEVASSPQALDRFKREIQLARKVTHPNVCRIFDFFYDDAGPEKVTFLTMELLRGVTLRQKIERDGRMRSEQAMPIVRQMAAGLNAAHSAGVIHRDFKSANVILVLSEGTSPGIRAVVTDFGLARPAPGAEAMTTLSGAAEFIGTPAYMAPEQIEGEEITPATDIYAFGVVMYEMVAAKLPFTGETSVAVALKRLQGPPVSPRQHAPDLDPVWENAILRCLQRRPHDRFAQIGNVIGALDGSAVAAPAPVAVAAPALSVRRRNLIVAAASLLIVFLLGLFVVRFSSRSHSEVRSRRSVAVLGFKNSTGQADAAWLSTALSEMLTTEIAAGEKLRAVPGETVARMRSELSLPDTGSFAPETLLRIRNYLGADVLVYGSYVVSGGPSSKVRLDLRLQDSSQGTLLASISEEGYAADLLEVVSRSGADLRDRLGVEQLDPAQAEAKRAALPATPQAARFYAEGLDRLRVYDAAGAQAALEKAIAADNRYALARSALATSWSMLGYAKKAQEQSKIALDLSAKLGREEQLLVEGRYRETSLQWKEAVGVYRTLSGFFPDNLEYGLRLASAQTSAGNPKDALATIEILRKFPPPDRDSPRIDLTEARAAGSLSDFKRAQAAASTAANKGRRDGAKLLVAGARLIEGNAFASLGESSQARAAFEDARQIYTEAADGWDAANASTNLAYVLMRSGDPDAAESIYRQSLALYRQLGDRKGTAAALAALATILRNRGDLGGARKLHEEALGIHVEIADRAGEATASNNIANTLSLMGDSVAARQMYEKALPIFKEIGDRNGAATVLSNLGDLVTEEGDFFRARALYEEARDTFQQIGNKSSLAYELSRIGDLNQINGDLSAARGSYEQALELRKQLGEKPGIGESQLELAQIALGEDKPAEAETLATAAVEAFRSADRPDDQASALAVLARSFLIRQKYPESAKTIQDAQKLSTKSRDAAVRISVAITAASISAARGNRTAALKDLDAAVKEARNASMIRLELEGRLAHAEIEIAAGRWQAGRQQLDALENEASSRGYKYVADRAAAARRRIPNTAA